jgi:hypothetical protein
MAAGHAARKSHHWARDGRRIEAGVRQGASNVSHAMASIAAIWYWGPFDRFLWRCPERA